MTADALLEFLSKNEHITMADDENGERLLFRNERLQWYKADEHRCTAIDYQVVDGLSADDLLREINRGLEVDGITRITGYFTKVKSWNPGKRAELKDRRRTDLEGHCPYDVQPMAAVG